MLHSIMASAAMPVPCSLPPQVGRLLLQLAFELKWRRFVVLPFYTAVDSMLAKLQRAQRAVMCLYNPIDRSVETSVAQPQTMCMAVEMPNGIQSFVLLVSYTCMSS